VRASEALATASQRLSASHVPDATLEAEVLLRHVIDVSRAELYASLDRPLGDTEVAELKRLTGLRTEGEPLAYILGRREFYGIDLAVTRHVLVPRQETELLVEQVLEWHARRAANEAARDPATVRIVDIGTGCGAIAMAIASSLPHAAIYATDISGEALKVADANRRRLGIEGRVRLVRTDLLQGIRGPLDVIVSNPPYIPTGQLSSLAREVQAEPRVALDGGPDGLTVTRRMLAQAAERVNRGGLVLTEIAPEQLEPVMAEAATLFPDARIRSATDLLEMPRAVAIEVD
jgi:release factor glutamine methyltransferase